MTVVVSVSISTNKIFQTDTCVVLKMNLFFPQLLITFCTFRSLSSARGKMSISLLCCIAMLHSIMVSSGVGQSLSTEKGTSAINVHSVIPTAAQVDEHVGYAGYDAAGASGSSNSLVFDQFDALVKQVIATEGANVSGPLEECSLRNLLEKNYLNFTTETGDKYCPAFFDEIQCWKTAPPGNVTMPCPSMFNGLYYDVNFMAHRLCQKNGQWGNHNRSNYSNCKIVQDLYEGDGFHPFQLSMIGIVGYSISLCTTLGALLILITCRSLWCLRNYIHINFLISFLIIYLVFFGYLLAIHNDISATEGRQTCPIMAILLAATVANFCWMLVEGIYLYSTLVQGKVVPLKMLWGYAAIGWVTPVTLSVIDIIVRLTTLQDGQTFNDVCMEEHKADYLIRVSLIIIVLINVYFLIHIIVVIVRRQRSSSTNDVQQYKKGLRALIVLTPLLGAAYLLFIIEPTPEKPTVATHIYRYMLALLQSTQGFFVALFYVFLNPEVHKLLKNRFVNWREDNTLFTNASSRKESKPSLPNIFHFAKTAKDADAKLPSEGDNYTQLQSRNGDVPNSSLNCGEACVDDEPDEPNDFHRDQRCPDTDVESAPFVRHADYDEIKAELPHGEGGHASVKV